MPNFTYKDDVDMAYSANKKRIRTEGAVILDAILNEALNEMTIQFNEALGRGQILEIGGSQREMKEFLRIAARKQLELPSGSTELD